MGNIKVLKDAEAKANDRTVKTLEGLLERAKRGEFESFVFVAAGKKGECPRAYNVNPDQKLFFVGALEFVKGILLQPEIDIDYFMEDQPL